MAAIDTKKTNANIPYILNTIIDYFKLKLFKNSINCIILDEICV